MPVLDAKALKNDPKGAAFLRGVLRQSPSSYSKRGFERSPAQTRLIKRRDELLEDSITRP